MKKKLLLGLLISIITALIVYLFIMPSDYKVSFKTNALPGTINQTLKAWNTEIKGELNTHQTLNKLTQVVKFGDSTQTYNWEFKALTDTSSVVTVAIKDNDHSVMNRIKKPFTTIPIELQSSKTVNDFYDYLKDHLNQIKITYNGESELQSTYCAYVTIKGKQADKAKGMMQNYGLLASVMGNNGVKLNGPPFVEVTDWNRATDSIAYNFCFPIVRSEKLPNHPEIKYKRIFAVNALKATYNGNYISSDRAWYTLVKKAKSLNKEIKLTPIEYFYNNPNMGGDALKWKAEIYMPLVEK